MTKKNEPDYCEKPYPLSIEDMNLYRRTWYGSRYGSPNASRMILCLLDEIASFREYVKVGDGYETQYTLEKVKS